MRIITLSLVAILATGLLISCGNGHGKVEPVQLNDGKKWKANPETSLGIRNMIKLVDAFPAEPGLADFHGLKEGVEKEFNFIFQECNMTGEAHNQLHNYLLPMTDLFKKIGSDDAAVCKEGVATLKPHLVSYSTFFE